MEHNLKKVYQQMLALPSKRWIIGYSGGLDSTVLVDLVDRIRKERKELEIILVHVNHGVNLKADQWAVFCKEEASKRGMTCIVERLLPYRGKNAENHWRKERYNLFSRYLCQESCLLTAHHAFDQIETYFLHLLRGAGLKGLGGMYLEIKPFRQGYIFRPFLKISKTTLLNYANQHNLVWVEDESNQNLAYRRNFLRFFLPFLAIKWPSWWETIGRSAENLQYSDQLLEEYLKEDLASRVETNRLDFSNLSLLRFQALVSLWLKLNFKIVLSYRQRKTLQSMIEVGRDRTPMLKIGQTTIWRYRNYLYVSKYSPLGGIVYLKNVAKYFPLAKNGDFYVNYRKGGEKINLLRRGNNHYLKKLFQEWGIPPFQRASVPLIFYLDQLVAIIGWESNDIIDNCQFTEKVGWKIVVNT